VPKLSFQITESFVNKAIAMPLILFSFLNDSDLDLRLLKKTMDSSLNEPLLTDGLLQDIGSIRNRRIREK